MSTALRARSQPGVSSAGPAAPRPVRSWSAEQSSRSGKIRVTLDPDTRDATFQSSVHAAWGPTATSEDCHPRGSRSNRQAGAESLLCAGRCPSLSRTYMRNSYSFDAFENWGSMDFLEHCFQMCTMKKDKGNQGDRSLRGLTHTGGMYYC